MQQFKPPRDLAAGSADAVIAVRHAVYSDLLSMLPPASCLQTDQFISNLALARSAFSKPPGKQRDLAMFYIRGAWMHIKVTPDIKEAQSLKYIFYKTEIEQKLTKKFGDRLAKIAGFFQSESGTWKINLPEECAVYGYLSQTGFYNGILFQPLKLKDSYFLLSAAKYGGSKALRLTPSDQLRFDACKHTAELGHNLTPPANQATLAGMKWNGNRFIEA